MIPHLHLAALATCVAGIIGAALPAAAQITTLNSGHVDMLDADGDGAVTKPEFDKFSSFAFDEMDADNNGLVSGSEFGTHMPGDMFDDIDTDGSGDLSKDEVMTRMSSDFADADRDGDGMLD